MSLEELEGMVSSAVKLDAKTWLWLIVVISSASIANIAGIHSVATGLRNEMIEIERRWVDRMASVSRDFDDKLLRLRESIPPPEVNRRFETLEQRLIRLESKLDMR